MRDRRPDYNTLVLLDDDACYRALCSKDDRFDGLFFVGVATTGIYCRPICPARTPGRQRCTFFTHAHDAERAGFRACFRCRPEVAPGGAPVDSLSRLARAALDRIGEGSLDEAGVDALADEMGVSARHVRRALKNEIGLSPIDLAQARRLALAKQLLHDTDMPVTDVAFVAGFASLRRFNAAFLAKFRCAPSRLRKERADGQSAPARSTAGLRLDFVPPYDWEGILRFLEGRAVPGVESVRGGAYRRTLRTPKGAGWFAVRRDGPRSLRLDLHLDPTPEIARIITRVKRLFDVDARPDIIATHLGRDALFAPLVRRRPGLRVPGAFDGFELAVRAILGQQVSVRAATTISGRLVERFGDRSGIDEPGLDRLFVHPRTLADASLDAIASVGMPGKRAESLKLLAKSILSGALSLEAGADPFAAMRVLESIPGIGPWTAHYVAMRALSWPDAFPSGDLVVKRALGAKTGREAEARVAALRPFRAYTVLHLWADASAGG